MTALLLYLTSDTPADRRQAWLGRVYRFWRGFCQNPLSVLGLVIIAALVLTALLAPLLADAADVARQSLPDRLLPPSMAHLLGTDDLGRGILVRVVFGTRTTLTIILLVSVIVLPIGLGLGTVAGYAGGVVDTVLMGLTDVFLAFPRLILALAFAAALGPGISNAVIAIALTAWPPYARLARAETRAARNRDFVRISELQGASHLRILWRQIVPLTLPSVVARLTLDMSGIILTAAGLGFLGLGAQPPSPEWGAMVASGRQFLLDQWWVATLPGVAIFVVSLGFNLAGDGLVQALDPRSR